MLTATAAQQAETQPAKPLWVLHLGFLFFFLRKKRVLKHIKRNNRDYIGGWNLFLHYTLYNSKFFEKTYMKFFSDQETGNALRITAVNVILNNFYFHGGWVGHGSDIPCPSVSTTNDLRWFTKWEDYLAHISVDCILWLTAPRFGAYKKRYLNQECTVGQSHSPHPQNPKRREKGLESQNLLQGHAPKDLRPTHRAPPPNAPTVSQQTFNMWAFKRIFSTQTTAILPLLPQTSQKRKWQIWNPCEWVELWVKEVNLLFSESLPVIFMW